MAVNFICAQTAYEFKIINTVAHCIPATAELVITGTTTADTYTVFWSNGQAGIHSEGLTGGDYTVHIHLKHQADTITTLKDTIIPFTVLKIECDISVPKYFSPNGDNYSDVLGISNIEKYPSFKLEIFNKWGQRVHHQQSSAKNPTPYEPWDGKWLGVDLPDGVYYYVIYYDADIRGNFVKGDVTILR